MKEKTIVNKILKYLNNRPACKAIKMHGSVFMERGTPDILCIENGKPVFIEVKIPGGKTTQLQDLRLRQWGGAGASAHIVYSLAEVENLIIPHRKREGDETVVGADSKSTCGSSR